MQFQAGATWQSLDVLKLRGGWMPSCSQLHWNRTVAGLTVDLARAATEHSPMPWPLVLTAWLQELRQALPGCAVERYQPDF